MYHNLAIPEDCAELWQKCHDLVIPLLKGCTPSVKNLKVTSKTPLDETKNSIYLIKEGVISEKIGEQLVVIYEEGDLVNLANTAQPRLSHYEVDFAVTVDEFATEDFITSIYQDAARLKHWENYQDYLTQSYQVLFCHFSKQQSEFSPDFRIFKQGETIIEENTEGDEVFTLVSGTAKVMSGNNQVGEIKKDEIFGAIAALTNTKRNASVIATSECTTIVVDNKNFRTLLTTRPDTVQKMVNDMARTIVSCNEKIIELSSEK